MICDINYKDTNTKAWLEFYDGENLLLKIDEFTRGVIPHTYEVDLNDIYELHIIAKISGPYQIQLLADGFTLWYEE